MIRAATYPAGTILRCPTCGATIECAGTEYAAACDGGGRHRVTQMRPVEHADSRERDAS